MKTGDKILVNEYFHLGFTDIVKLDKPVECTVIRDYPLTVYNCAYFYAYSVYTGRLENGRMISFRKEGIV